MVMATQTYVTDMQALNPVQQVTSQAQNNGQAQNQVKVSSQGQGQGQTTTIIQPSQTHSGQQFIVTITGEPQGEQVSEGVQLQQGTAGQVIYQPQQPYEYQQGTTMYTPGTYYQSSTSQMTGIQGQLLSHQGNTYLVQGSSVDNDGHPLTHTTRASPATGTNDQRNAHFDVKCWQREVQWLIENYETAEGVSLPRSTLYNHYLRHCQEQKIDPMNPASFGKLIRSVFLGLRTRRLGTRGNSKYHYYGIRIKATSPLNQYTDEQTMAMRQQPVNQKRFKSDISGGDAHDGYGGDSQYNSQQYQHQQFLGDASAAIPTFGTIEIGSEPLPPGITQADLTEFEELYKEHCEAILDIVVNLQFSLIEALWQSFWRNLDNESENGDVDEHRLSKEKLYALCRMPQVQKFVRHSDYAFYQAVVEVLIPDVLRPIPGSLTQAIRNFAKSLENWLKSSTEGIPDEMVKTKINAVSAFAQTLRRYTSLNHLAQAARAVLQNTAQITQMLSDLNRVDFTNVQEQASWVCQCEDEVVHKLEQDFKKTLQQQNSLEQWAVWLESVVQQVLSPYEGKDSFPKAARQFLLKWSFYSSMVIRDLTLRSAASFGSFHLIRLLYDEYMFYLVEHKVADATGESPIAVMGEVRQFIDLGPAMSLGTLDSETKPAKNTTLSATTTAAKQSTPTVNGQVSIQSLATIPKTTIITSGQKSTILTNTSKASLIASAPKSTILTTTPKSTTLATTAKPTNLAGMPKSTIIVAPVGTNHALSGISNQIAATLHTPGTATAVQTGNQVRAFINNPSAMTVVSSAGNQPKTFVVMPVSAASQSNSGDSEQMAKKLKTT
ncbi:hypothetical protein LSH36_310g03038 [Paralvinella palmiformis]|uniref:RFX-type winged-helix domain-containing protein n=1 Tax=Paralvinella palmiformis TaxID=53620 RepID=A0AAD9JH38_9ANNE|nr:hypothetical protein LSH36_310g03038 [Paralvinella palmiformis]